METPTPHDLLLLPERHAAEKHLDGRCYALFRWQVGLGFAVAVILAIAMAASSRWTHLGLVGIDLAVIIGLVLARGTRFFSVNLRLLIVAFLLLQFGLLVFLASGVPLVIALSVGFFPPLLLVLRLPPAYHLLLGAVFAGTGAWTVLQNGGELGARLGSAAGVVLPVAAITGTAVALSMRERSRFVAGWRRDAGRERERVRMRDEIADARKIQLSMLPPAAPELPWLDLATISLPATEVGGDYYDFFPLDGGGLAVVVGDVAGHGVGSGLVLSGVRSGLYLLRDELDDPGKALLRLNRMVRDSVRGRMYVTLLVAILDPIAGRLRVVSAGHPPPAHYRYSHRDVVELGDGAPPLGTRLPAAYPEAEGPLAEGDIVLFYTDGLTEMQNLAGEPFGDARLHQELARVAHLRSALKIRDSLLHALSIFKGDALQIDDLTLVVARVGAVGGGGRLSPRTDAQDDLGL